MNIIRLFVFLFPISLLLFISNAYSPAWAEASQDGPEDKKTITTSSTEIDSLLLALEQKQPDTTRVNILNELSWVYKNKDFDKALQFGTRGLELSEKSGYKKGKAKSLQSIGNAYLFQDIYEKATEYLSKSLKIFEELEIKAGIATIYNNLGLVNQYQGNYSKAEDFFKRASVLYDEIKDKQRYSLSLSNLGLVNEYLGNYEKAIQCLMEALKIDEELNDKHGIAANIGIIGLVYMNQNNNAKAIEYLLKSLKMHQDLGNLAESASAFGNLGLAYMGIEEYEKSIDYYHKSLKICEALGSKRRIAGNLNNVGNVYAAQGNNLKALEYWLRSLKISKELGDKEGVAVNYGNLGIIYTKLGNYQKAEDYIKKSLSISKAIKAKEHIQNSYQSLAELFAKQGNYRKAYKYNLLSADMQDSLFSDISAIQITELQEKYEAEKRDKEIELLNKDKLLQIVEIDKKAAEVKKQTTQKYAFILGFVLVLALALVVYKGYRQKRQDNLLLATQKQIIETKNKDITDSIRYAERIQNAILPTAKQIKELLPDSFVLFRPKDIVSGDFYWLTHVKTNGSLNSLVAAADCTGHGVPGAFMSMICSSLLNEAVNEKGITKPSDILKEVRKGVIAALKQTGAQGENKDGMDVALCNIDIENRRLEYAGAYNSIYIVGANGDSQLREFRGDKQPVGFFSEDLEPFTNHEISMNKGETIYISSDGYIDQFGGPKGKKFKSKPFKDLLVSIQDKSMAAQKEMLEKSLDEWKGSIEQVDDILVIGIRV